MSNLIDVEVSGIPEMLAKVNDPDLLRKPLKNLIRDAAATGKIAAMHNIRGGTEQAGISIRADVQPLEARVFSAMPHVRAMSIEEGRKVGEEVPFLQIVHWRFGRYTASRNLTREERKEVLAIQEAIRRTGSKAKRFIAGAAVAVKKEMPRLVSDMARAVEEAWRK